MSDQSCSTRETKLTWTVVTVYHLSNPALGYKQRDAGPLETHVHFSLNDPLQHGRLLGAPDASGMQLIGLLAATCEKVLQVIRLICFKRKGRFFIGT